jgi:hypothetical protein
LEGELPLVIIDIERFDSDGHTWCAVSPIDGEEWLDYLANKYRELRTEPIVPLSDLVMDGITVLACDALKHRLENAVLPDRGSGILRVERSDFGETISYCLLEDGYGTRIGYKSIRDRELIQLTGRGIDAIGVECSDEDGLCLVLGETKTSADHRSPPQVVDTGEDSLRAQHCGHLSEIDNTSRKVWDAARRARDKKTQELLFACALYFQDERWDKLSIIAFSCLVRPRSLYKTTDFGSFHNNPDQFSPCRIRFTTFCVPSEDLETVVDEWLNMARGEEVIQ